MAHHHKEAGTAELKVEVGVDKREPADLHLVVVRLDRILSEGGKVVGCGIAREISCVSAKIAVQHMCDFEAQVKVRINVDGGQRQDILVG